MIVGGWILLYSRYDFTITIDTVSVMKNFWIELDGFFCETNTIFTKPGPLSKYEKELSVTIVDRWKLLISLSSSLDPPWLNYDIQRTGEDCSNVNSVVVYVDGERPLFVFISNQSCNQDFNETVLETLSMTENVLKLLLTISGNVNIAGKLVWG